MKRQVFVVLAFLFAVSTNNAAVSKTTSVASAAAAPVALVVAASNGSTKTEFTLSDLQAMPQTEVITKNEFVDGIKHFKGPLARDILKLVGAKDATTVTMTAANDYKVKIPVHEFFDYDAILAISMDGHPFSRRDKGPIWVIYPMSDFSELQDPVYNSRLIWQLVKIVYK